MSNLAIRDVNGAVVFEVKVVPGSSRTAICGLLGRMLKLKVSTPAEKGKANESVVAYLAGQLGVKKNCVRIVSGRSRPVKQVQVSGISAELLRKKLELDA